MKVGYDSNYFLRAPSEGRLSAYRLRITQRSPCRPSACSELRHATTNPDFTRGAYVSYNELIATDSQYSSELRINAIWTLARISL